MKKRCNFYIENESIEYLRDRNINISKAIDKLLSIYVDLMKMSENELVLRMEELRRDIAEKTTELKMLERRLIELADEVDE